MNSLSRFLGILDAKDRINGILLLLLIGISAFFDTLGVASILPFLTLLIDPTSLNNIPLYLSIAERFKFDETSNEFVVFIGFLSLGLFVSALIFRALATFVQIKYTLNLEYKLGKRLLKSYLGKPYWWFTTTNTSSLEAVIISELNLVISHGVIPIITIFAQGLLSICLLGLIIVVDPIPAIIGGTVVTCFYCLIYFLAKPILISSGEGRISGNRDRFAVLKQAFVGVKEIKVAELENFFFEEFLHWFLQVCGQSGAGRL